MGGFALNFDAANTMSLVSSTKGLNLSSTTAINDVFSTVASAATPDIWTGVGGVVNYTGVVTATGFAAAPQAGAKRRLVCAGAAVFTAGANVLIAGVASGSNYTAAADDVVEVTAISTTQFLLVPLKYDGSALRSAVPWAVAGGTADAITATYAPPNSAVSDGLLLAFRASAANTTTTPTFAPDGLTARTITKTGGTALLAGDIVASLSEYFVRYNAANTRWELMNPSVGTKTANTVFAGPTSGGAAIPAFRALVPADLSMTPITNSLSGNVALNNSANYFDGPSVAQGTSGTWFASGTVSIQDTAGAANFDLKLWDGTTVIASCSTRNGTGARDISVSLSGFITSPAGNIRISVKDPSATTGQISFNSSGNSKDSTITAIRIA